MLYFWYLKSIIKFILDYMFWASCKNLVPAADQLIGPLEKYSLF